VFGPTLGGQSGVEGYWVCAPESVVVDLEQAIPEHDYSPADALNLLTGPFETTVRWATIKAPGSTVAVGEALRIEVGSAGEARYFTNCRGKFELDVTLKLHSEQGTLDVEVPAVVSAYGLREVSVTADFPSETLGDWAQALQGSVDQAVPSFFRLQMTLLDGVLSGAFSVIASRNDSETGCELALWPAARRCEPNEHVVSGSESYRGLRSRYLVEALQELPAPTLDWTDGSTTQLQVRLEPSGNEACVLEQSILCDDNCDGSIQYAVPGSLHLKTADGRLDLMVPGRVTTRGTEGAWGLLGVTTSWQLLASLEIRTNLNSPRRCDCGPGLCEIG
jgi:hypothetical protein